MTSNRGAGFSSRGAPPTAGGAAPLRSNFDPRQYAGRGVSTKIEKTPEGVAREMEMTVNQALEAAATAMLARNPMGALEKAKEAVKLESALEKYLVDKGLQESMQNTDLAFAVKFNLADCVHRNGLPDEALRLYEGMLKDKAFQHVVRVRVNMGNIYFEKGQHAKAIKQWRMVVDQLPNTSKELRGHVQRNIALAWVRAGQMGDAMQQYQQSLDNSPDYVTGYNLVVCAYAVGDKERTKAAFQSLLQSLSSADVDEPVEGEFSTEAIDSLRDEQVKRRLIVSNAVLKAARIVAPSVAPEAVDGYTWVVEQLEGFGFPKLAGEVLMCKAEQLLREKKFAEAMEVLKGFEKKDKVLRARAAGSLASIAFLEGNLDQARAHVDLALADDEFCTQALVAKGNVLAAQGELEEALGCYKDAVTYDADAIEAIYNSGVVARRLAVRDLSTGAELAPDTIDWMSQEHAWRRQVREDALERLKKVATRLPNLPDLHVQIAQLYELASWDTSDVKRQRSGSKQAIKWLETARAQKLMGTDPSLMVRLGAIFNTQGDEPRALRLYQDAHEMLPSNLEVNIWLGVYYVRREQYMDARHYFELLAQIQPAEVKWELMAASCIRRSGDINKAFHRYARIADSHRDNVEALRYAVELSRELRYANQEREYSDRLAKAQQAQANQEAREAVQNAGPVPVPSEDFGRPPINTGFQVGVRVQENDEFSGARANKAHDADDWALDEGLLPGM